MPLHLYKYSNPDSQSTEIFGLTRLARQLSHYYKKRPENASLIVNLDPNGDSKLPRVDGLLIAESFTAIIHVIHTHEPVRARYIKSRWTVEPNRGYIVSGKYKNPYLQIKQARSQWINHFNKLCAGWSPKYDWENLHAAILFHPTLNPDSRLPSFNRDREWLTVQGISQLPETIYNLTRKQTGLSVSRQEELIRYQLNCTPWIEMESILDEPAGTLVVLNGREGTTRLAVRRLQEVLIGRSQRQNTNLTIANARISRVHAKVRVNHYEVLYEDLGSRNGTYLNGKRLAPNQPIPLLPDRELWLGSDRSYATVLKFEPRLPAQADPFGDTLPDE